MVQPHEAAASHFWSCLPALSPATHALKAEPQQECPSMFDLLMETFDGTLNWNLSSTSWISVKHLPAIAVSVSLLSAGLYPKMTHFNFPISLAIFRTWTESINLSLGPINHSTDTTRLPTGIILCRNMGQITMRKHPSEASTGKFYWGFERMNLRVVKKKLTLFQTIIILKIFFLFLKKTSVSQKR